MGARCRLLPGLSLNLSFDCFVLFLKPVVIWTRLCV